MSTTSSVLTPLLKAVVKVFTISDPPDYDQPWQTRGTASSTGSGVVVDTARGLRVLTNAHCVENHVFVELRRHGHTSKFVAEVEFIGHECDLALLTVEDPSFFEEVEPVPLGDLPNLSDRVSVLGYPVGGERLSITEGIVSRIDMVRYAQRRRQLLAVQVDAAINAGNSGGPVLRDGKLVGVAFQSLDQAEQIGYMISPPVIEHFLRDVETGNYDGFPSLGVESQRLENKAHRRMLKLPESEPGGIMVADIAFESSAWGHLQRGDVITGIDGHTVLPDGTINFREGEQLTYHHLPAKRLVGETAKIVGYRDGAAMELDVPLRLPARLVKEHDGCPPYFVYGGIVFAALTMNYLKSWGDNWKTSAPYDLVTLAVNELPTPDRIEVALIQKVLPHSMTQGYYDIESEVVAKVQGKPIRSLAHLIEIVETDTNPFITFGLEGGRCVVVSREAEQANGAEVLERFDIEFDRALQYRSSNDD